MDVAYDYVVFITTSEEDRATATGIRYTGNFVKFGHAVFEIGPCEQTYL